MDDTWWPAKAGHYVQLENALAANLTEVLAPGRAADARDADLAAASDAEADAIRALQAHGYSVGALVDPHCRILPVMSIPESTKPSPLRWVAAALLIVYGFAKLIGSQWWETSS